MFEYQEPDTSDRQGTIQGTGSLPLPSESGGQGKGTRSLKPPTPEKVRHMLYGSLAGINRTIKILHALGYADPNDWSDPIPVPASEALGTGRSEQNATPSHLWMAILTKTVLIE